MLERTSRQPRFARPALRAILPAMSAELLSRITIEPGKRAGKPCIRRMRIAVSDVLRLLASGMSREEILADYPELEPEDIEASLLFAAEQLEGRPQAAE